MVSMIIIIIVVRQENGSSSYGGIAQLGERLNGIQEVSGSIPLISTISSRENEKTLKSKDFKVFLFQKWEIRSIRYLRLRA